MLKFDRLTLVFVVALAALLLPIAIRIADQQSPTPDRESSTDRIDDREEIDRWLHERFDREPFRQRARDEQSLSTTLEHKAVATSDLGAKVRSEPFGRDSVAPDSPQTPAARIETVVRAISRDDAEGVKQWLESGGDANAKTDEGESLIRRAVRYGRMNSYGILHDAGANLHPDDGQGNLLDMAVRIHINGGGRAYYREDPRIIWRLIDSGVPVTRYAVTSTQNRADQLMREANQRLWSARDRGDFVGVNALLDRVETLELLLEDLRARLIE